MFGSNFFYIEIIREFSSMSLSVTRKEIVVPKAERMLYAFS